MSEPVQLNRQVAAIDALLAKADTAVQPAQLSTKVDTTDSRLTNARTPTAHAGSHASGGSDPITPAAIGAAATSHTHTSAGILSTGATDGHVLTADGAGGTAWEAPAESGAAAFTDLTDSPAAYTGQQGKLVKVNATEDGLIFGDPSGTSVSWGDIAGTIADQTDLTPAAIGAATAAQGSNADTAHDWGDHALEGYLTTAPVSSVAGRTGAVTLSSADVSGLGGAATLNVGTTTGTVAAGDDSRFSLATTSTNGLMAAADKSKLDGVEAGAQVNVATNIAQGTRTSTAVPITSSTGTDATLGVATTSLAGVMSAADKTKLDGVAANATANDSDANLLNRANHTGTQSASTITGLASVATAGTFVALSDSPADYTGQQGKLVKVNATEDGLIFGDPSGSAVAWGDITGTISAQTDLTPAAIGAATSAQGANADTAHGWGDHASAGYLTTAPVTSVAGKTGVVTLAAEDVSGLGGAAVLNVGTTTGTVAAGDHGHAQLHDPVTISDSTSIDLTLTGQQISAAAIFGTTSGTVCQGNDARLSDARTPASHTTGSHSDWPAAVSMTEVGYLDGVSSAIQTQLNGKQATLTAASQVEMEAGTESAIRSMSPLRVAQAIAALGSAGDSTIDIDAKTPAISGGALAIDLGSKSHTWHVVTLNANLGAASITVANVPAVDVIRVHLEFRQATPAGTLYDIAQTAFSTWTGTVDFDSDWSVYQDATPTIAVLLSVDGGTTWRVQTNAPIEGTGGTAFDTLAELNAILTDATLDDSSATRAPSNHDHASNKLSQANTHESADTDTATTALHHTIGTGANQAAAGNHTHAQLHDAVTVADSTTVDLTLTGQQISAAVIPGGIKLDDFAAPDDNTDLNATTLRHGLLPKLSGSSTQFLNGSGAWTTPDGGGGGGVDSGLVITEASSIGGAMTCTFTENTSF
ncbi:MAG: hypothetical protein V2I51_18655 [Anderseniella sp.]|jgi:hypothetical protein|nr:hypothetical protein [Anderseniella sp.]